VREGASGSSARIAWFEEAGAQTERNRPAPAPDLPAPGEVVATSGRGQVTVDWRPVDGAAGYVVHRAAAADGPWQAIDNRSGDLLAVPHPPYADTTGERGVSAWYAVAALPSIDGRAATAYQEVTPGVPVVSAYGGCGTASRSPAR